MRIALAGIYLPRDNWLPILPRARWPLVCSALRKSNVQLEDVGSALRTCHLHEEAAIFDSAPIEDLADLLQQGRVLTPECDNYPSRWLTDLGASAPPALWCSRPPPKSAFFSIVGSREIDAECYRFCREVGMEAVRLGFTIVSGGADGCDRGGVSAVEESAVEILAHGIEKGRSNPSCKLSLTHPKAEFSTAAAMQRNALVYAASGHTFIGNMRYGSGGTWIGAMAALRARSTRFILRHQEGDKAVAAFKALGAAAIATPSDLAEVIRASPLQPALFQSIA